MVRRSPMMAPLPRRVLHSGGEGPRATVLHRPAAGVACRPAPQSSPAEPGTPRWHLIRGTDCRTVENPFGNSPDIRAPPVGGARSRDLFFLEQLGIGGAVDSARRAP